jgi:hypothetical protein
MSARVRLASLFATCVALLTTVLQTDDTDDIPFDDDDCDSEISRHIVEFQTVRLPVHAASGSVIDMCGVVLPETAINHAG